MNQRRKSKNAQQAELDFGPRFSSRFLDKHAGKIVKEPLVALIELVTNSWDANATEVEVSWPFPGTEGSFKIKDNGHGMTAPQVHERWPEFYYNRLDKQGKWAEDPPGKKKGTMGSILFRKGIPPPNLA